MFHKLDSAAHKRYALPAESSPDRSSCSSDTGDVLIRSTRVLLSDRRHEAGPGPGSVLIAVKKLRDPPVKEQLSSGTEKQQRPKPQQKPDRATPVWAAADSQPDTRTLKKKPEPTKENRQPECSPDRKFCAGTQSQQQPGHDLLTSRFAAGGRGVVLAALKQCSHSATHRREVRVQLMDPRPPQTSSQNAPGLSSQNAPGLSSQNAPGLSSQNAPGLSSQNAPGLSSQNAVGVVGAQMDGCPRDDTNSTAALMKVEARVSQLADEVNKLLQADRERGWSLSRQTLHHLETLHSRQLQLQTQLLESALRIVTGDAPVISLTSYPTVTPDLTAAGEPAPQQVTHLDSAANLNQQRHSSATIAAETTPVAMATPHCNRRPEQTRHDQRRQGTPSVSTATRPAAGSHLLSPANHTQPATQRANEMPREMGRLKTEMKMLPEDSLKTTRPAHDLHQSLSKSQQTQSQQSQSQQSQSQQSQSQQSQSQQTQSQQSQSQQTQSQQSQSQQSQSQQSQSQQTQSQQTQSQQSQSQQSQSQQSQSQQTQSQQSQSQQSQSQQTQSQQTQFDHSSLQHIKIHQIQSQNSKTVQLQRRPRVPSMLEEAGEVLRQVRRQKKVLEENLEALLRARTGEVLHCELEALAANRDSTDKLRIKRTVDAWIKDIQADLSSEDVVTKHSSSRDAAVTSQQRSGGSSAHTGRGRPVSVLRGTGSRRGGRGWTARHRMGAEPDRQTGSLRDSEQVNAESYLTRLYGRAPYEGLRRTLKKSPYLRFSSPGSPISKKPRPRLVESIRGVKVKSSKTQTCLAPPLILPPQHHYIISSTHLTSGDPADLTVTPADSYSAAMAIPLGRPRVDSSSGCPAKHQQEVTSPPTAPPTSSVVAMDNGVSEHQSKVAPPPAADEAPPPHPPHVDIMVERTSDEEQDEENIFPGTDLLSVVDIIQQEELSVVAEEEVQLDGGPSPPPVLYQGPVFPPRASFALSAQDQASVLGLDLQRDALESRLVEWVEQQLMSRMISEMYCTPPSDPTQDHSTDQSESKEQSITSDIVEAAGGGGLQLFVDSNMSVDSALIRQLVDEVLTEQVALMLEHRDPLETGLESETRPPEPGPGAYQEEKLVLLVSTPVPTPPPSPAPPSHETPPLTTPSPSEPTSLLNEESPKPTELVATPTPSPEPIHSAGSPPAVHLAPPPLTWEDAELPLEEERPEDHLDTHTQLLLMSVAQDEPPLSSPSPPHPPPPCGPVPGPVMSLSSSTEESSSSNTSSSSSSLVTAGTDAALKHISEGELLLSLNQLAAMTEEEAVCSFSSSLQELQEMDFDPPSEGQVRGHNLLFMLLTKMEQGVTQRGERPQPEGSWGRGQEEEEEVSVGEVRDGTAAGQQGRPSSSSPGQISQSAEASFVVANKGSVTVGDLMEEPVGTLTFNLQTDLSLSPPLPPPPHLRDGQAAGQVVPVLVSQDQPVTGGGRRMDVHLPFIRAEKEVAGDTDSSTSDVL